MWVLDASVVLEVLLKTPLGTRHAERVLQTDTALHALHLLDVEVAQVLRRLTLAGEITEEPTHEVLENLVDLPLIRHEHVPLLDIAEAPAASGARAARRTRPRRPRGRASRRRSRPSRTRSRASRRSSRARRRSKSP